MKVKTDIDGFSLIEMLIALTVIGIGIAVTLPAMQNFTNANRQAEQINKLVGDITYAKSEAIKRGTTVTISQLKDADDKVIGTDGNWFSGWEIKSGTDELKKTPAFDIKSVTLLETSNATSISFSASGRTNTSKTFQLCGPDLGKDTDKELSISVVGRITIDKYDCTATPEPPPS